MLFRILISARIGARLKKTECELLEMLKALYVIIWFACFFSIVCTKPLDIVVAVDVSGSTTMSDFNKQVAFLRSLVDAIQVSSSSARLIIFAFDHNMNSLASSFNDPKTRSRSLVKQQINSLTLTAGATTIDGAIVQVKEFLNTTSRNVPRVVAFLTDGVNYGGSESLRIPAQELRTVSIINK